MARPSKSASAHVPQPQSAHVSEDVPAPTPSQSRVYRGAQELDHDLFKLLPTRLMKNVGYQENEPIWVSIEHSHIFHTIDSNGRAQDTSNAVGGHHHAVTVTRNGKGVPSIQVSGPMVWVKKRVGNKTHRVAVPVNGDDHTHEVQYLGSEKIKARAINEEFAKFDAAQAAGRPSGVPGVVAL